MQTHLKSVILSSACNYTYLQNFTKLRLHCLTVRYIVVIKDFSLHSVNCIANNILPPPPNVSSNCNMPIHKLRHCGPSSILLLLMVVDEHWYGPFHGMKSNKRRTICTGQNTSWWTDSRSADKNSRTLFKLNVPSVPAQEASIAPSHCHSVQQCCHAVCEYPPLDTWYVVLPSVKVSLLQNTNNNTIKRSTYKH
jgi:hypothetical protein